MRRTAFRATEGDGYPLHENREVMTKPLRGGKTTPRLLQDLSLYNPHQLPKSGFNILTELALQYEGTPLPRQVGEGTCQHRWGLKLEQSNLPELDCRPNSSSKYTVAAYCTDCRCHLYLLIDYRGEGPGVLPCPKEDFPLHHFIHNPKSKPGYQAQNDKIKNGLWVEERYFKCSSPSCLTRLSVSVQSPKLKPEWVSLLTDRSFIKQRAQRVMDDDPGRFEGHAVPSPIQVLTNLRAYISNAMTDPEPRRILGNNKKWLLSLAEPCADLLHYLGFSRQDEDWLPPRPDLSKGTPFTNPLNILLDDVDKELLILISQQPEDEKRLVKPYFIPKPAMPDIERVLGCQGYKRSIASRTIDLTQDEEHPFYAGLGAKGDFHDELISFAYDRQVACDPDSTPYYLECLQGIAEGRKSEDLQTKEAIEASSGKISVRDIRLAYQAFGLAFPANNLDDDTIIGTFQARVSDAPKQEPELRRALVIIGQSRSSAKIQHIASNTITTYEQALSWLNATESTDDSFLITMYEVKVDEDATNAELARNAIYLIAQKRNSLALKTWLETGRLGEVEMDIGQAYARLGIDDRTIEDDIILHTYNFLASDAPSQIDDLKRALTAIAKSKGSQFLQSFLCNGIVTSEHPASEWPVGLENIGNTCYLNSLLQFYFTVKPLRDLVLNFDEHKMQVEDKGLESKRVGSRKVSKKEIERAQRFVYELQRLFRSMITAPYAQVTPEQELARLTLISSTTEEHIRRQSILGGHRPSLGEINGQPVHGPLLPPNLQATQSAGDDIELSGNIATKIMSVTGDREDDTSSEATLVETPGPESSAQKWKGDSDSMIIDSAQRQQQAEIQEDKENLPPRKTDLSHPSTSVTGLTFLEESSPSRTNEQLLVTGSATVRGNDQEDIVMGDNASSSVPTPPSRPPPVPPRQKPEEQKKAIQEEVEIGAQQDVTEVIANVLFQLQCAIKPETVDESGEQIDKVKRLFFGKQKSYTTNEQGVIRTKEEFISDIKVDVASGPRDIYAALDGAFDVQQVEVGGSLEPQYTTISQLPPVLQVLVQRAQFDPEKKSSFKSTHHLDLKETIYMDRYMDSLDAELMQRRTECWGWKKDLAALEARKVELTMTALGVDIPGALIATVEYMKQIKYDNVEDPIEISDALLQAIEQAAKNAKLELSALDGQIKTLQSSINTQFADLRTLPYRLHSVFIHRGMVSSGHYWIYIYDFAKSLWRKYNDGYVTEVKDTKEIYEAEQTTRPATPYFLVYVRDEQKDKLVDAVCRDTIDIPPATSQDTVMVDDDAGSAALYEWAGEGEVATIPEAAGGWDTRHQGGTFDQW